MKLNRFTDYGLRILMYIAKRGEAHAPTITEISNKFSISRNHLIKVVQFLSDKQIIVAKRGRGGGLRLGESPKLLQLGTLIDLLEKQESLISCREPNCLLEEIAC